MATTAVQRSNEMTARWCAALPDGTTTAVSGVAVWPLLAYLAAAAEGSAQSELESAVGIRAPEAPSAAAELISELGRSPPVRSAIGLWTKPEIELSEWWRQNVFADVQGHLAEEPAESQRLIDTWVRDRTAGLIEGLPTAISADALVLLIAALTVRTAWKEPFRGDMLMPQSGPWAGKRPPGLYRSSSDRNQLRVITTAVGMLSILAVEGEDDVVVELALGEEGRRADEILGAAFDAFFSDLPSVWGSELDAESEAPGVQVGVRTFAEGPSLHVALPRFSVSANHDLLTNADLFGLQTATDARYGHFPRFSDSPLCVGAAGQGIAASFTDLGFEAAAVTYIEALAGGVPPLRPETIAVRFDRPFAFVVRLRSSGLVLLAGWVAHVEDFPDDGPGFATVPR